LDHAFPGFWRKVHLEPSAGYRNHFRDRQVFPIDE
jgi:hypothetical protein